MSQPLSTFVHQALSQGISRDQITQNLQRGGWSPEEIRSALEAFVDGDFPVPVPRKRASTSPKEAFLFLVLFSALYTWMFALGAICFDLLNLWLPQPGEYLSHGISSLRTGLASVIVAFPLFLYMDRLAAQEARRNPGQCISPIRRWLTYLTLFAAASALVSSLISLTLTFLEGELTLRFGLKIAGVGVLAGTAFAHYLSQLKRDEKDPSTRSSGRGLGPVLLAGAVAVLLGVAFWHVGSPLRARLYRQDDQRVRDLMAIQNCLENYAREQGHLPASLADCDGNPATFVERKVDSVSAQPYVYRAVDASRAELGATFALPSSEARGEPGFWKHGPGPTVFRIDVRTLPGN